eukprot:1157061-Pelagomonas_calceolata.AAC.4
MEGLRPEIRTKDSKHPAVDLNCHVLYLPFRPYPLPLQASSSTPSGLPLPLQAMSSTSPSGLILSTESSSPQSSLCSSTPHGLMNIGRLNTGWCCLPPPSGAKQPKKSWQIEEVGVACFLLDCCQPMREQRGGWCLPLYELQYLAASYQGQVKHSLSKHRSLKATH